MRRAITSLVLGLYPPSWRARYADEVRAFLDESTADGPLVRPLASLAWRAAPMWLAPARHLHDQAGRLRATLATVLAAWTALTGIVLVFVQLTQLQGFGPAAHPVISRSYLVIDAALATSAVTVVAGGLPLWLQMAGQAWREHRRAALAGLMLPFAAPAVFLAAAAVTVRVVHHPEATGNWWFLAFTVLGFAAAGLAAAGPAAALRVLRPSGRAVRVAGYAAGLAAGTITVTAAATAVAATGLCRWATGFAGYHQAGVLDAYIALVGTAVAVTTVSAARGLRALRPRR